MIDQHEEVRKAHEQDNLLLGTVDSWLVYVCLRLWDINRLLIFLKNLTGGVSTSIHITDPTNASRTLLLSLRTLKFHPALLKFFGFRESILPRVVSSSEVYGSIATGALKGVEIAGMVGDQQGALVGNKCLTKGEAKCTYGTGAFLLFCTGNDIVRSRNGLVGTVSIWRFSSTSALG
jgi:glycerol kinase